MHALLSIVGLVLLSGLTQAAPASQPRGGSNNNNGGGPRVGIAVSDKNSNDLKDLVGGGSKVDWYYTWELNDSPVIRKANPNAEFLPQVGPREVVGGDHPTLESGAAETLRNLRKSGSKRLLCLNEPDEEVKNGGTKLTPALAAKYYKNVIMPLRNEGWQISHPVVTGSPRGLDWLQKFAAECRNLNGGTNCPTDFVSVHWYGAASGLENWVTQLDTFYRSSSGGPKFWFTELGVPKAGVDGQGTKEQNEDFLTQARQLFQKKKFVEAYAWFGVNREGHSNAWTGPGVSLFNNDGKLNKLGAMVKSG